jgi:tail-anchored protein insertion receptor
MRELCCKLFIQEVLNLGIYEANLTPLSPTDKILTLNKTSFDWTMKTARWLSTNGFILFIQFYHTKTPMFELPPGWFPYYVEWVLSFPRAPLGTVSTQVWCGACAAVIHLMGEAVTYILGYIQAQKTQATPAEKETQKSYTVSKKDL